MRAAFLAEPGRLSVAEVDEPTAADLEPGQVLVEVLAGGICGSDMPFFRGSPNRWAGSSWRGRGAAPGQPGFPMHEVAGRALASRTEDIPVGSHVVGWANEFNGLADKVRTDGHSLAPYEKTLAAPNAVLAQPLACVLYAVERLGNVVGLRCAVIGLGAIGMLFAHVLTAKGGDVVGVDRVDRSAAFDQLDVGRFVRSDSEPWAELLSDAERPEVVVEAVGHQVSTLRDAITAVALSGRIFYFGVPDDDVYPINMESMVRKNLALMAGGTLDRRRMLSEALEYLEQHPDLHSLVTHVVPLAEAQRAYDLVNASANRLKVVVSMLSGV
ncbi:MAG: zinc-binding dehydrogenase [Nostocoides sp.]